VIIKPLLKLGPQYIEFKRGHLYNFNPVGFGSMLFASAVSIVAFFGFFGPACQAFSAFIALGLAFVAAPIVAIITKGRYYLARQPFDDRPFAETMACTACGFSYEKRDMTSCPFHSGTICSLCCSLESSCGDICKPAHGLVPATAPGHV
jgi:hypothetical protein